MEIQLTLIGDGSARDPLQPDTDIEWTSWINNGDGTAAVEVTREAMQMLETVRRQLKEDDPDALIKAANLSDGELDALIRQMPSVEAWGNLAVGTTISVDKLLSYEEDSNLGLYRCIQQHDKQETWPPPSVPALFVDEAPTGVIPQWQQPEGAHDAYHKGDLTTLDSKVWESDVDGNVWEPPTQWTETTA